MARLIDADALKDALRTNEGAKALGHSVHSLFCVDEIIDKQPTVDSVEVVHGRWEESTSVDHIGRIIEHGIDCSVCDSVFKDKSREVVKRWKERFEHCPFCGADMRGDGNG